MYMKKINIKYIQIFIIFTLILGILYLFNYKEGAKVNRNPCSDENENEIFCNKRTDCTWYKGRCKTFGPGPIRHTRVCIEYPDARCINK